MVDNEEWVKPLERRGRLTAVLALASLISAFGSSFQYGYNVAVVNSPSPFMQQFYNTTYLQRYGRPIEGDFLTLLWSLSVSMYPLGGFFGSLMVAPLVNKLGRKGTLLFNNIFSIVPAVMMGVSEIAKSYEIIIIARFIVGICAGLSSNVVPMYLGELSPKNLRGALGIIPQLFITIGILSAQVLGIRNILGNNMGWTLMLGLTGIPALVELLLLPFFPESPRYMLIQKGDEDTAKKMLQRLRGWEDVDAELSEMRLEEQSERAEGRLSVLSLLSQRSLRWQLVSIIVMNMGQQLSGVNAIYYYADSIYASAGVEKNHIQYVTVGTGAVNVFMTIAAVFIVEASGRRLLLLCGFGICCGSCVLLTVALNFQESVTWMPYVSIACVIIYVIGHAIGPSPIPYVVTTEMFRQSARPSAFMVAGSVHWFSNFIVGLVFPFLEVCLSSNVVPMYLGELSPKNLRGALGIIPQLFITIGILSAQVLGIRNILGNNMGWTLMLGLTGIPALVELLLLPFFPESPRYMLIQKGDEDTAKKMLQRLRGWEDVDAELSEMRLEEQSERAEGRLSVLSLLSQRSLRWQLVSIIVMNMGQQLSGVNAIYYYADSIYASAGVEKNHIQYVTVGTGAVNVFMTIAAVFIVEASGRRLLLLCGFGICCGSCVLLTVALNFQESVTWMPYVSIACVIIYVIGHAIGPSPIPYVVTTEMFRQSARPSAFMVAGSVHWFSNFIVGLVFPFLERGLGSYSFILFSIICLVTLVYIWLVVPETKNKTFLEICQIFAKRNKVEIKLGDGDLALKESKESLEDAVKVTAF